MCLGRGNAQFCYVAHLATCPNLGFTVEMQFGERIAKIGPPRIDVVADKVRHDDIE